MAKQRVQADLGLRPERLRPVASPVDTYVQPPSAAATGLGQLADALGDFAPEVARFSNIVGEKAAKKAQAAGIAAARKAQAEGKEYREAIADGTIHPSQSPWFRLGYEQQYGRVAAQKYTAAFMVEAAAVLAESTDVEDFDRVEREFRERWTLEHLGPKERSGYFQEAFGNSLDGNLDGLRRGFAAQAGNRMVTESNELLHQEVMALALDYSPEAPEVAIAAISHTIERTLAQGTFRSPGAANRTVVDAVVNAAKRANNVNILGLLDGIVTDKKSGSKLSGTKYAAEAIEQATNQIGNQLQQDYQIETARQAKADRDTVEALGSKVISGILDGNLSGFEFGEAIKQIAAIDPSYALAISDARYKVLQGVNTPDPDALDEQSAVAYEGKMTGERIVRLLRSGEIDNSGARALWAIKENVESAGGEGAMSKALKDPLYTFAQSQFLQLFGDATMWDNETEYRKLYGGLEFRTEWQKWFANNPNATPVEKKQAIEMISQAMVKKHADPEKAAGGDLLPANPYNWRENPWFNDAELTALENRRPGIPLSDGVVDKLNALNITGADINEMITSQRALLQRR